MIAWTGRVLRSFSHAWDGLRLAVQSQRNLQIHLVATLAAVLLGLISDLANWEWGCLILCIGLVWMAELFNTAIEILCDRVTQEQDDRIRQVKDVAASAVLVASLIAVFVALLIFL